MTPTTIGAIVVPIRAKKLNRPICPASPSVSWAISVCDPDQPNDSAAPWTICSSISGQNQGSSGISAPMAKLTREEKAACHGEPVLPGELCVIAADMVQVGVRQEALLRGTRLVGVGIAQIVVAAIDRRDVRHRLDRVEGDHRARRHDHRPGESYRQGS